MRIVAGRWRGRKLRVPKGNRVRPTADRVREAWMSIVQSRLVDSRVLDLYAGSGALGLEALSRGAVSVDFVETAPESLLVLRDNITALGADRACTVHRADAMRFIADATEHAYDVAFADPPYRLGLASRLADCWLARPFARFLGIEHEVEEVMPAGSDTRRYGSTALTFFGG